jgi:hypothetical protein
LRYELKPNQKGFFHLAPLRTNSRGLRDVEYTLEKPANTFRVAVMGSSFTAPSGVAIQDAFHSILEERLTAEFGPTRYEFINLAVDGHAASEMLIMIERRALAYDPDLILVGATRGAMRALLHAWDRRPPTMHSVPVSHPIFDSFLLKLMEIQRNLHEVARPWPSGVPKPTERATVIQRLGEMSERTGIPVVVVHLSIFAAEPLPFEVAAKQRAEAEGLYYMDTHEAFRGTDPRDFWIHGLNMHPNARANEIFADAVGDFLRTNHLLERPARRVPQQ